jgi:mRNA interferase MazF
MNKGDICLGFFPFVDTGSRKLRPVLVLTDPIGYGDDYIVAYISSAVPRKLLATDVLLDPMLPENKTLNLKQVSVLRLHKVSTLHKSLLKRHLGVASSEFVSQTLGKIVSILEGIA